MKILILGGTRFIGRHIAEALLDAGHLVTVFTRGQSPDELPDSVERLHGDRNNGAAGLEALVGHSWDECVDVSGYTPRQVRASVDLLWGKVDRYVFVSTVSVYQESQDLPVRETHPLLPEAAEDVTQVTGDTYGPLKVTCERIVSEMFGPRATILRPQIVAGPHDPTGRHTYWVQRAMQGGDMLAPGDGTDMLQVVDVRDIARFTRLVIEQGIAGTFNMAGPRMTWRSFVDALGAVSITWVPSATLADAGLNVTDLPLYLPAGSRHAGVMDVSHDRASQAGFTITDASRTIEDTRAWLRDHPVALALSPEQERDVLARARAART